MDSLRKEDITLDRMNIYARKMKEIDFMADHICDIPEIFETNAMKCKLFLIKIFTVLHPNFHYLSFVSQDDIEQELVKIASILQIYPHDPSPKKNKSLQNMNENDAHIFWTRLFNLCKIHCLDADSNIVHKRIQKEIFQSRFSSITEAIKHMNYNITMINPITLSEADINQEINTWGNTAPPLSTVSKTETSLNSFTPNKVKKKYLPEINNVISSLNYIEKKIHCENKIPLDETCYFHKDFFVEFNFNVKEMSMFKRNLSYISSVIVANIINSKILYNGINWLLYKNQIKKCNDIIERLISTTKDC